MRFGATGSQGIDGLGTDFILVNLSKLGLMFFFSCAIGGLRVNKSIPVPSRKMFTLVIDDNDKYNLSLDPPSAFALFPPPLVTCSP